MCGEVSTYKDECDTVDKTIFPDKYRYCVNVTIFNDALGGYEAEPDKHLILEVFQCFLSDNLNILWVVNVEVTHEELEQKSGQKNNKNKNH
eukprot:2464242-Ditylum_brightwellii.AAC.1